MDGCGYVRGVRDGRVWSWSCEGWTVVVILGVVRDGRTMWSYLELGGTDVLLGYVCVRWTGVVLEL